MSTIMRRPPRLGQNPRPLHEKATSRSVARSTPVPRAFDRRSRRRTAAIAALDGEVPRAGAWVRLHQYGGGPDEGQIIANETGYLRLGIELLKAAMAPPSTDGAPHAVEADIGYLVTGDSDINFDWFERRNLPEPSPSGSVPRFVPMLVFGGFVAVGAFALIGLITIVRWLVA